jgi:hypothetical protein
MSTGRAYIRGFALALRRWPMVLTLFLASLLTALSFAAAAWSWLAAALGNSLATRSLLADLNVQVFIDLLMYHSEGLEMLLLAGSILAAAFVALGVWLNAAAIVAVGDEISAPGCLLRGVQLYPTYLGLWALSNGCMTASAVALFLCGRWLTRWTAESTAEMTFYWIVAGGTLVGALSWLFFATVHDHARIRSRTGEVGALRAFGWALAYVGRRQRRALPLAALLLGTSAALWAVYHGLSHSLGTKSASGVTLSLLAGEAVLLARMFLRVWWFAAETHLQRGRGGIASQALGATDRPTA